jgi:hypothetical protein
MERVLLFRNFVGGLAKWIWVATFALPFSGMGLGRGPKRAQRSRVKEPTHGGGVAIPGSRNVH